MNSRKYHIVAINERTGDSVFMTRYPMEHDKCCTMLKRFTQHKGRRLQLVEALK
jgi:hypothetical protein